MRCGINLISGGVALVTLATFFHEEVSSLLGLAPLIEARFVYLGLFWGGTIGCVGIVVAVAGIFRGGEEQKHVRIVPAIVVLAAVVVLFFVLLFSSFDEPRKPRLRPGDTILI